MDKDKSVDLIERMIKVLEEEDTPEDSLNAFLCLAAGTCGYLDITKYEFESGTKTYEFIIKEKEEKMPIWLS